MSETGEPGLDTGFETGPETKDKNLRLKTAEADESDEAVLSREFFQPQVESFMAVMEHSPFVQGVLGNNNVERLRVQKGNTLTVKPSTATEATEVRALDFTTENGAQIRTELSELHGEVTRVMDELLVALRTGNAAEQNVEYSLINNIHHISAEFGRRSVHLYVEYRRSGVPGVLNPVRTIYFIDQTTDQEFEVNYSEVLAPTVVTTPSVAGLTEQRAVSMVVEAYSWEMSHSTKKDDDSSMQVSLGTRTNDITRIAEVGPTLSCVLTPEALAFMKKFKLIKRK
jgi:hypothetical protein